MTKVETPIAGLFIIQPKIFEDDRGFFCETYNSEKFADLGITHSFEQDNHSKSIQGTVRALHYQTRPGQAKLVRVVAGRVWDVAVDIRRGSPTLGQWFGVELSADNRQMLYIPAGFAHGFCVLSETADFVYKCSSVYNPETETGIAYDDPTLAIPWPVEKPLVSERDTKNPAFDPEVTVFG